MGSPKHYGWKMMVLRMMRKAMMIMIMKEIMMTIIMLNMMILRSRGCDQGPGHLKKLQN